MKRQELQPDLNVDPDGSVPVNAALIIPLRVAELLSWELYISDPLRVAELHRMRISAKRLRYTMEMFAPFFGPDFKGAIGQFKKIQQQLGDIHDADVLVPELAGHIQRILSDACIRAKRDEPVGVHVVDLEAVQGLLTLCRTKRDERDAVYRQFLESWRGLRAEGFFDHLWIMIQTREAAGAADREAAQAKEPVETIEGEEHGATKTSARNRTGRARTQANGKRKREQPEERAKPGEPG